jgi:MoxR-like ATPase
MTPSDFQKQAAAVVAEIQKVMVGLDDVITGVLTALLADGNVLLEGLPGLGKTRLVDALSKALSLESSRIQFTPDLMPADVTGTYLVVDDGSGGKRFNFHPGPIFANVVLADEINRATPKTQAALLEAMQERQVTLLGETRTLPDPFIVVATQNPIELEGTYPLPEAQLDRFLLKLHLTLPDEDDLVTIAERTTGTQNAIPNPVLGAGGIAEMRRLVRAVPVSPETARLAARIVLATHPDRSVASDSVRRYVRFGASPRGMQAMILAGKVRALLMRGDSRQPVLAPEDLLAVASNCLRHRIHLGFEGEAEGVSRDELITEAVQAARSSLKGR